ncbi:unnamed protein product [Acanthosepion pharaonis]|uniref:Uncharacterized protein n=1 Tax=Acanthosepion pharaonis TaxID=158019 RepID=A0A812D6T0_ACAPH|nr:unnamed protein product [Sepia pharaonis]
MNSTFLFSSLHTTFLPNIATYLAFLLSIFSFHHLYFSLFFPTSEPFFSSLHLHFSLFSSQHPHLSHISSPHYHLFLFPPPLSLHSTPHESLISYIPFDLSFISLSPSHILSPTSLPLFSPFSPTLYFNPFFILCSFLFISSYFSFFLLLSHSNLQLPSFPLKI